ncbi:phage antirepressor KilAC domain-containing protein [Cedecea sp.]|jgi:phage antirepressor YoqD-like protein|uniref:phage antirepressor KilAC domain-containing protein n=1 Tax=Cedecea sp. TaxID=1970739 RepID=UPI002F42AF47
MRHQNNTSVNHSPVAALAGNFEASLIRSDELLAIVNEVRCQYSENPIRNNVFIDRIKDELDGEHYKIFVVQNSNKTESEVISLSSDQATLVSMRESKAVRRVVLEKLKKLQAPQIPRSLPEALRLAADLAEENTQLVHKVQQDAPKVAFVNHYVEAGGAKGLRETAKILNMPEKAMIDALVRDKVLFRQSGNLLPHALRQRDGLFTVKTGTSDFGHAFTQTRVTPRGIQWIAERYASELMGD